MMQCACLDRRGHRWRKVLFWKENQKSITQLLNDGDIFVSIVINPVCLLLLLFVVVVCGLCCQYTDMLGCCLATNYHTNTQRLTSEFFFFRQAYLCVLL